MAKMIIENWELLMYAPSNYSAPEQRKVVLRGRVFNHDYYIDGTSIVSSKIIMFNIEKGLASTNKNIFKLGDPNKKWSSWLKTQGHELKEFNFDVRS